MGKTNLELGFRAAATALKLLSSTLVAGEDGCLFCPTAHIPLLYTLGSNQAITTTVSLKIGIYFITRVNIPWVQGGTKGQPGIQRQCIQKEGTNPAPAAEPEHSRGFGGTLWRNSINVEMVSTSSAPRPSNLHVLTQEHAGTSSSIRRFSPTELARPLGLQLNRSVSLLRFWFPVTFLSQLLVFCCLSSRANIILFVCLFVFRLKQTNKSGNRLEANISEGPKHTTNGKAKSDQCWTHKNFTSL